MKKIFTFFIGCCLGGLLSAQNHSETLPGEGKYVEKEIQVTTGRFVLPGTLTLPEGKEKVPVIILLHGSGPANRDEAGGPNKPFRDLAQGLAGRGIASIRYDKRTYVYRHSATDEGKELTPREEVIEDALSAIRLAQQIPELDARQIYILGHSLGGMMVPRIAQQSPELAGGIIFSGPSRPLGDVLSEQLIHVLLQTPQAKDTNRINTLRRMAVNVKKAGTDAFDPQVGVLMDVPVAYWAYLNQYDQVRTAKDLSVPLLIMQGERDYQVTMEDFKGWQDGLGGKENVTFCAYPKLNHIFMEGEGMASPIEYLRPGKVASYVLDDISNWIHRQ